MTPTPAIDWSDLETAFDFVDDSHHTFLDRQTGKLVGWSDYDDVDAREETSDAIDADRDRYVKIERIDSAQEHDWMSDFTATVSDPVLRRLLDVALRGRGAFRRFKDVLLEYPAERERWFAVRDERVRGVIMRWLEENGLADATLVRSTST